MRAPSTDLLRALRRATATNTSSSSTTMQAISPRRCHHDMPVFTQRYSLIQQTRRTSVRAFSTTSSLHQVSSSSSSRRSLPSSCPTTTPAAPSPRRSNPYAPSPTRSRGPTSKEDTQTDFQAMDIYASAGVEQPATSIDACTYDGFHLNNGVVTSGGRGIMLLGGEGFVWSPWNLLTTANGQRGGVDPGLTEGGQGKSRFPQFITRLGTLDFHKDSFGLLALLHPKPDLLIFGTGDKLHMLSKETRAYLSEELGIKVDVMDTANASAAYNLLAMERGPEGAGAILLPIGFRDVGR